MIRKIAWLLIAIGVVMFGYNALEWWGQASIAIIDPKTAVAISDQWDDTTPLPMLEEGIKQNLPEAKRGEKVGEVILPRMGAILPIVRGTDEKSLKKGVGLYEGHGTVKPGETGHVVLSGHRDTVFRGLDKLKPGDKIFVKYGTKLFTYQFRKSWITHPDDRTVIVPHEQPVLSLTTCYPFDYVGDAPERYIIRAELVKAEDARD
ncbi:class D sortase [Staphylospora marina]|uniref:class D sortase n=1 Tax=Staphylospora marina TaxID=2490858 RepID=UPI0013DE465B|nr:class D sortase [Staphylospora marina]